MKEKLIALLKQLGLLKDDNQETVLAELDKLDLENPPAPIDTSKISDPETKKMFEELNKQISALTAVNKNLTEKLGEETKARDAAIKAQQDQQKAEQDKKVNDAVDAAIKSGKFPEAKREHLKKLYTADFDSTAEMVKDAPVDKHFKPSAETKLDDKGNPIKETPKPVGPLAGADKTILAKINEMNNAN